MQAPDSRPPAGPALAGQALAGPAPAGPADRPSALRFLTDFAATVEQLQAVLDEETAHLAAGRIRAGLAREAEKADLAGRYLRAAQEARRNAVALARFAPAEVAALRAGYDRFRITVERNQAVLATARAVSEGLVRGVAEDLARRSRPTGYGSIATARAAPRPLMVSARV